MASKKGGGAKTAAKTPAKGAQASVAKGGNTQDALKAAAGLWKSTPAPEPGSFGNIPDGKYQAKIEDAVIENGGKNRDRLQIKWSFRISGPTNANRMVWMNTGLADDKGVEFSKRALMTLGLELPGEIELLPETLGTVAGIPVEIALVTKPGTNAAGQTQDYQNCYMNKRLDVVVGTSAQVAPAETTQVTFVGQTVEFDGDGKKIQATVEHQDGDKLSVKDLTGEIWEVAVNEVSIVQKAAATPAAAAPAATASDPGMVGKTVSFKDGDGKEYQGKVVSADGEGNLGVTIGDEEWSVPAAEVTVVTAAAGPVKKGPVKKSK